MTNTDNKNAICEECDTLKMQLEIESDNHVATRVCLQANISSLEIRLNEVLRIIDELRQAIKERDEARAEVERFRKAANTNPEPSRLEIAANAMQGILANPTFSETWRAVEIAIRKADELIAAAKEVAE